ncbi:Ycf66 family protein [Thalassoporum mexicanum]|uniref:Ycf66 family protein n=1 Tax=Thalassoporum mexicanum TaxID=3457544 RepID=UPI00030E370F|nr:Ycf66 family protein [Pseudanabaena sp. PCC 7367]
MILLAIVAALGGVGLYFVRSFRPELARDHDIFFSAIALVYGIILLAFNFRMEITTQLAQVLIVGFGGWFVVETLTLRSSLSNQARRAPMDPIMDDPIGPPEYPEYRVEIDPTRELSPRRSPSSRRMRGAEPAYDERPDERPSELRGDIEGQEPSRRARRPRRASGSPSAGGGYRGSSPSSNPSSDSVIDIDEEDIKPVTPRRRRPRPSGNEDMNNINNQSPPPRRRRPSGRPPARNPSNYVRDEQDDW